MDVGLVAFLLYYNLFQALSYPTSVSSTLKSKRKGAGEEGVRWLDWSGGCPGFCRPSRMEHTQARLHPQAQ